MKKLFFILSILIISNHVLPQSSNIRFEHLTVNDGLSHNKINCILQDSIGFMWFGTDFGLNRYDGFTFKTFSSDPEDSLTISGPSIRCIFEDKSGNLWIGSSGLNLYNNHKESFVRYIHQPNEPKSISKGEVTCVFEDITGNLWIGTEGGGLNLFEGENKTFIRYSHSIKEKHSLSNNNVSTIFQDGFGVLWIGTGYGLNKFDSKNQKFVSYFKDTKNPNSIPGNRITSIFEDKEGNLWIGTNPGGLCKYERENDKFISFKHDPKDPNTICSNRIGPISEDMMGNIIIGTNNGYSIYNAETGKFSNYRQNAHDYYSLNSNYITSLYKDASGIIWLGTYTEGLNKYESKMDQFNHFNNDPANINSLSNNNVTCFTEDASGNIWIGTKGGGLNKYIPGQNKFIHYRSQPFNPNTISFNTLFSLEEIDGDIWAGSIMLDQISESQYEFNIKHYGDEPDNENSLKGSVFWDLLYDSKGNLWSGSLYFLNKVTINEDDIEVLYFTHDPDNPNSLGEGQVETLYEDPSGTIWIGAGGLNQYVPGDEQKPFVVYKHDPGNARSLSNNNVKSIMADDIGNLWIGTEGGGLDYFNQEDKSFIHFTEKDGLPSNVIYGILKDNSGNLWLSTNKGLAKFNPKSETIKVYGFEDGIQGSVFNQGAYYESPSGKMFFGGTNGFISFFPDSIKDDSYLPSVAITNFKILNKNLEVGNKTEKNDKLTSSIITAKEVNLSHKDYLFSIEFAALHFAHPEKNQYAYRLVPFEKEWNYTDAKARVATYTNLRAGKYIFEVKGTNSDKRWNNTPKQLSINISPPFWFTWWAYALYVLILIGLLFGLRKFIIVRERYKNDLKLQRVEAQKSHELNQLKLRFFTNVSHEFRTPLTLIIGPLEKMLQSGQLDKQNIELFELMNRNAKRLLKLVNQIMDFRKIETGNLKLDLSKNDIIGFIYEVANSFKNIAELNKIDYIIETNVKHQLAWFDTDKLEKIIYNLLSNAFKYTPQNGKIVLSASVIENYSQNVATNYSRSDEQDLENMQIIISVEDNGIGIPKEAQKKVFDRFYNTKSKASNQEGTGIGLEMTKEMVLLHKGKISVESEAENKAEGKTGGSCFTVILPLGKGDFEIPEPELKEPIFIRSKEDTSIEGLKQEISNEEEFPVESSIILIVEDNPDVRLFLRSNLNSEYKIIEAANGQEGLELAQKHVPDIILSDIMMPVMDGLELCKLIKTDMKTSHIPLILLTARATDHHKIEGLETGADDYITKPFNIQEIDLKLMNILETRKRLQEKFSSNPKEEIQINEIVKTPPDEKFMIKATEIVHQNISNPNFDNKLFIEEIGMSRTQLYRKLKALTNQSVHEFIRTIRLKKALELLKDGELTISEITFEVGFSNHSYFNKCFREFFGVSPTEYLKKEN